MADDRWIERARGGKLLPSEEQGVCLCDFCQYLNLTVGNDRFFYNTLSNEIYCPNLSENSPPQSRQQFKQSITETIKNLHQPLPQYFNNFMNHCETPGDSI
jgi:hypothetical protein